MFWIFNRWLAVLSVKSPDPPAVPQLFLGICKLKTVLTILLKYHLPFPHWYLHLWCISYGGESESCSVLSDSLPPHGLYTVHGILQARILEWAAVHFSSRSQTQVSHTAGEFLTSRATREAQWWGNCWPIKHKSKQPQPNGPVVTIFLTTTHSQKERMTNFKLQSTKQ